MELVESIMAEAMEVAEAAGVPQAKSSRERAAFFRKGGGSIMSASFKWSTLQVAV